MRKQEKIKKLKPTRKETVSERSYNQQLQQLKKLKLQNHGYQQAIELIQSRVQSMNSIIHAQKAFQEKFKKRRDQLVIREVAKRKLEINDQRSTFPKKRSQLQAEFAITFFEEELQSYQNIQFNIGHLAAVVQQREELIFQNLHPQSRISVFRSIREVQSNSNPIQQRYFSMVSPFLSQAERSQFELDWENNQITDLQTKMQRNQAQQQSSQKSQNLNPQNQNCIEKRDKKQKPGKKYQLRPRKRSYSPIKITVEEEEPTDEEEEEKQDVIKRKQKKNPHPRYNTRNQEKRKN